MNYGLVKQSDNAGIEAIIKKNPIYAGKYIMKDMLPVKMSAVILDFARPLFDKTDLTNKRAAEKTVQKAVEIWNNFIVIEKVSAKAGERWKRMYKSALAERIRTQSLSFRINKADFYELLKRKETLYPENKYFILEYNVRWSDEDSQMHLTVLTNDASHVKL